MGDTSIYPDVSYADYMKTCSNVKYGYLTVRDAYSLGYAPAIIYLNGQLISHVVNINDVEGWIEVYQTSDNGDYILDETGSALKVTRIYGHVVYIPAPR